jgi:putative ABC transport system permease protein
MFALFCSLSLRHMWKHWVRAGLVIASIALGVAAWVTTEALYDSVTRSLRQAASPMRGVADIYATNNATRFIDASLAPQLQREVAGIDHVEPIIIETVTVVREDVSPTPVEGKPPPEAALVGLKFPEPNDKHDPLSDRHIEIITMDQEALRRGLLLEKGREWLTGFRRYLPDTPGNAMPPIMRNLGKWASNHVILRTPVLVGEQLDADVLKGRKHFVLVSNERRMPVEVIGTIRATGPAATLGGQSVLMVWQSAARLLGQPGEVTRLDIHLKPGADLQQVLAEARERFGYQAKFQTGEDQDRRLRHVLKGLKAGFRLCGFGALVVGLFLVYNAMSVSVAERRHDIGILRSVGASRSQVRALFVGEALLVGIIGSLLGLPLGIGLAHILLGPIHEALSGVYLPIQDSEIRWSTGLLAMAAAGGQLTSLIAGFIPASRAASEEPADAVRRAPPFKGLVERLLRVGGAGVLILGGVALVALKPYLPEKYGTFAALGLILLGSLLLTPTLAAILNRFLQKTLRNWLPVESRLAVDNLVRSPGRTGLVIAAWAAGVALTVQTAGMIKSNEEAYRDWIDATFKEDLYLTSGAAGTANAQARPLSRTVGSQVTRLLPPGTRLVGLCYRYPDWGAANTGAARTGNEEDDTVILMTLVDAGEYYRVNSVRDPGDPTLPLWKRLSEEEGTVIISDNFARMHGVKVGDEISLESKGRTLWRVIGTVVDYNWIRGSIWIDRGRPSNMRDFGAEEVNAWDVYLPEGERERASEIRDSLQKSMLGATQALVGMTRDEIRDNYLKMITQIYGLAYKQQLLVGIVAVLGVVASLLISVLGRQRELGLLRAVGATRPQVMHTVLAEAVLIGVVGTILGIVIGMPLEWYWVRIILFEESGFLFDVRIPWMETLVITGLSILSATIAGLAPAAHAVRMNIPEAIAYE